MNLALKSLRFRVDTVIPFSTLLPTRSIGSTTPNSIACREYLYHRYCCRSPVHNYPASINQRTAVTVTIYHCRITPVKIKPFYPVYYRGYLCSLFGAVGNVATSKKLVHSSTYGLTPSSLPPLLLQAKNVLTSSISSPYYSFCLVTLTSRFHTSCTMAKSKFEYVRQFETDDPCLPNCWLVVRIDGKAFHKFTEAHHYMKPNDERGLGLMTRAAQSVMGDFNEIVLAYGQSDEFSFVFHRNCKLYNRRASKIMTNVVSLFASSFTLYWSRFFNSQELQYPPSFDARVVMYPSDENLKDYLSWRQADCHINNLYNTCFWKLVQEKGLSPSGAQERLKGTLSSDKNEILFTDFNINYNSLPELYRKGTVIIRPRDVEFANDIEGPTSNSKGANSHRATKAKGQKASSVVLHCDIIGKQFWEEHPYILSSKRPV